MDKRGDRKWANYIGVGPFEAVPCDCPDPLCDLWHVTAYRLRVCITRTRIIAEHIVNALRLCDAHRHLAETMITTSATSRAKDEAEATGPTYFKGYTEAPKSPDNMPCWSCSEPVGGEWYDGDDLICDKCGEEGIATFMTDGSWVVVELSG